MITNHRLAHRVFFLNVIGLLLFGCSTSTPTPSLEQMDKSPFTGTPCMAPCWQGLVISESNETDVMLALPKLTFIDQDTIHVNQILSMPGIDPSVWTQGTKITANCVYPDKHCLTINIVDDVLTEIVIELNYEIKLNEINGYLGNPNYVGYQELGAEIIICEIYFVWSSSQLVLVSEEFHGEKAIDNCDAIRDTGKPASNINIFEVRYMSAIAIENLLSAGSGEFFEYTGTIPDE